LYNKAIELSPSYIDAIKNRASLYGTLGEKEKEQQDMVLYNIIVQNAGAK
jgi:Tfp pilus assembly protein PilF